MLPTKIKDLLPKVATELGIPENELQRVIRGYYKENKQLSSALKHTHIKVEVLGAYSMKGWEIQKKIDVIKKKLSNVKYESYIDNYNNSLTELKEGLPRWKEYKAAQQKAYIKKKEYRANKKK